MRNNILVTGANGFVGTHLVRDLSQYNEVVSVIRDIRSDYWTNSALNFSVKVFLDLNRDYALEQLRRIISYYEIDQIYHLASQAIVSRAINNPLDTYLTNIIGSAKIFEAARNLDVKEILYISTDKVYGEGLDITEKSLFMSSEPYSTSKICTEYIAEDYRRDYGLNISIARPCNIIGYDLYNPTRIVPSTILKILSDKMPTIYDIDSVRQYIYVRDVVKIIQQHIGNNTTLNIGSPYILRPREIIEPICEYMNLYTDFAITPVKFHEINKQSMIYDPDIKYTPMDVALKEIIRRYKFYVGKSNVKKQNSNSDNDER